MLIILLTLSFSCIFLLVRYMIYLKKLIDKKTAENFGIDYMDVNDFVNAL